VTLLGDRAWWLPAWLDRLLPNLSLEGPREPGDVPPALEELEPEPVTVPV
jgi:putative drug exporter of the RND superfamily